MIDRIMDHLYITGGFADIKIGLAELEIDAVLIVAKNICDVEWSHWDPDVERYEFPILDIDMDQTEMFRSVATVATSLMRKGKNVLVSCSGGVSRSSIACICIVHEMTQMGWDECEALVKAAHPQARLLNRSLCNRCQEVWDE